MLRVVVVVDDEPDVLEVVCQILEDEGYPVFRVAHPGLLMALPPDLQPILFLVDLMLPLMNGIEVARRLRGDGHPVTPMIAMSASDTLLSDAQESGMFVETLDKPFSLVDLLDTVARYAA